MLVRIFLYPFFNRSGSIMVLKLMAILWVLLPMEAFKILPSAMSLR